MYRYQGFPRAVLVLLLGLSSYAAEPLRIAVTTSGMQNVFSKIDKQFTQATGIPITYIGDAVTGDSIVHFASVLEGKADASTAATPYPDFVKNLRERGITSPDLDKGTYRLVGRDLMIVFAHSKNGVNALNPAQLVQVFSGEVRNWKELGGADLPIQVVLQNAKPTTLKTFQKIVIDKKPYPSDAVKVGNHTDVVAQVTKVPGSIGFVPHGTKIVGPVVIETQPIGRPIYLVNVGKPKPDLEKLIKFIQTEGPRFGVGK